MTNMEDAYSHCNSTLVYVIESIPGPSDDSEEYKYLCSDYNSQVTHSCECASCIETCKCIELTGGNNHYYPVVRENIVSYQLNKLFNVDTGFIVECNDLCICSDDCGNRLVQKGPIDCLFVKDCNNGLKGLGLFTHKSIAQGTFICEYAGELLTKSQAIVRNNLNRQTNNMNYIFCLSEHCKNKTIQTFIDPSYIGNIGRYINHSCEPNCKIIPVRINSPIPKLAVFSSIDILPEAELTFDYGCNSIDISKSGKNNRKKCFCGSQNCRGVLPLDGF